MWGCRVVTQTRLQLLFPQQTFNVPKCTTWGQHATTADMQLRLQQWLKNKGFTAPQKTELTGSQLSKTIIEAQRERARQSACAIVCVCVCWNRRGIDHWFQPSPCAVSWPAQLTAGTWTSHDTESMPGIYALGKLNIQLSIIIQLFTTQKTRLDFDQKTSWNNI